MESQIWERYRSRVAWKNGVEAPIYNGVSGKGSEMLENRGTSIRKESPFMDVDSIPDGVFLKIMKKKNTC